MSLHASYCLLCNPLDDGLELSFLLCVEVRLRGVKNFPGTVGWQKPEIRSNLGEALALTDPVSHAPEMNGPRAERLELWKKAHSKSSTVRAT